MTNPTDEAPTGSPATEPIRAARKVLDPWLRPGVDPEHISWNEAIAQALCVALRAGPPESETLRDLERDWMWCQAMVKAGLLIPLSPGGIPPSAAAPEEDMT